MDGLCLTCCLFGACASLPVLLYFVFLLNGASNEESEAFLSTPLIVSLRTHLRGNM